VYDLGVLFTNSFSTALEFRLAGVRHRLGYAWDGRSFLLDYALSLPNQLHQIDRYDNLLTALSSSLPPSPLNLLKIPDGLMNRLVLKMSEMGLPLEAAPVVICPGAAYGTAKQWLAERFFEVTEWISAAFPDRMVLCLGGPAERALIEKILHNRDKNGIHNLAGKLPLELSLALISVSACVLANDSGLMHAAWGLNVPLLALFGPNDPQMTGPLADNSHIIYKQVACSPCSHRHCPTDHRCMTAIHTDEVVEMLTSIILSEGR